MLEKRLVSPLVICSDSVWYDCKLCAVLRVLLLNYVKCAHFTRSQHVHNLPAETIYNCHLMLFFFHSITFHFFSVAFFFCVCYSFLFLCSFVFTAKSPDTTTKAYLVHSTHICISILLLFLHNLMQNAFQVLHSIFRLFNETKCVRLLQSGLHIHWIDNRLEKEIDSISIRFEIFDTVFLHM